MKKRNKLDFQSKTKEELISLLEKERKDMAKLLIEVASSKTKNTAIVGHKKKNIACILTLLRAKELSKKL